MNLRSLLPDRNSIATRLAGWFLLIALVPCVFLLAVTAYFSRRSLEATVRQRLMVICDAKAAQLEEFIAERQGRRPVPGQRAGVRRGGDPARRSCSRRGRGTTEEYRARGRPAPAPAGRLRRGQLVRELLPVRRRRACC